MHATNDARDEFLIAVEGYAKRELHLDEVLAAGRGLHRCDDILPGWAYQELGMEGRGTYAAAVWHVRERARV